MRSPVVRTSWSFLLGGAATVLVGWSMLHADAPASSGSDLQIQYARTRLALAETNLQQAEEMNRRVRGAVSSNAVNEYRRDVKVAHRHLESLQAGREGDEFRLWLDRAEANQRAAAAQWKSAKAVNARVRGAFEPLEVRRMELQAKLDSLLVEQGKSLAAAPREDQVVWQLEVLANETKRLSEEVHRTQRPSGYYPYYFY
jgi:hypothetical protein